MATSGSWSWTPHVRRRFVWGIVASVVVAAAAVLAVPALSQTHAITEISRSALVAGAAAPGPIVGPDAASSSVDGDGQGAMRPLDGGPRVIGLSLGPPTLERGRDPLSGPAEQGDLAAAALGDRSIAPNPATLRGYQWPIARGRITNSFGPNWYGAVLVDHQRFHDGLDLATFCGDHVYAAHDGTVVAAGRNFDPWVGWLGDLEPHTRRMNEKHLWGSLPIVVVIDDGNGYRSIYAHFNAIAVKVGQRVTAGHFLGWEGQTGFASGCHLHYGLFSPFETAQFELRPDVAKKTKYPAFEIARIDPLLVLPGR